MNKLMLPLSVRTHRAGTALTRKLRRTWQERHDETGLDEAVTKMVWLAVGIAVAIAGATFFLDVFDQATANVPDPVAPTP